VLALAQVAAGIARQLVDAQEQARILNRQPCLLGELLQQINFFSREAARAPVINLDRADHFAFARLSAVFFAARET